VCHEENDKPPNVVGFPQHVQTNNPYSIMLLKQCQKHKLITMKIVNLGVVDPIALATLIIIIIISNYHYKSSLFLSSLTTLTGWWYTYPSEKYEFVSWEYYSQYMENKIHVPKHQPVHHSLAANFSNTPNTT